jgi:hypothetical protein
LFFAACFPVPPLLCGGFAGLCCCAVRFVPFGVYTPWGNVFLTKSENIFKKSFEKFKADLF